MVTPEMIARINVLSKKNRETGLTDEERSEQAELRRQYIEHIRTQVKSQLDCIKIVDHDDNCDCGCKEHH